MIWLCHFGNFIKMIAKDFNGTFESELTEPEFAALYLKAALQDNGIEGFLLALHNVIKASRTPH
jgi:DNA-binding phage protein